LTVHDASELIWMVDAVVVTCRSGETTTRAAERVQEVLVLLGAPPGGVVLLTSRATGDRGEGNGTAREAVATVEPFAPPAPSAPEPSAPPAPTPSPEPTPASSAG